MHTGTESVGGGAPWRGPSIFCIGNTCSGFSNLRARKAPASSAGACVCEVCVCAGGCSRQSLPLASLPLQVLSGLHLGALNGGRAMMRGREVSTTSPRLASTSTFRIMFSRSASCRLAKACSLAETARPRQPPPLGGFCPHILLRRCSVHVFLLCFSPHPPTPPTLCGSTLLRLDKRFKIWLKMPNHLLVKGRWDANPSQL